MILSPQELIEPTGKGRSDAQRRELDFLGVPYRVRRDNSLVVLRDALAPAGRERAPVREPVLQD